MSFKLNYFTRKRDSQQVSELKHEIANRDTEIRRLESLRSRDRLKINELEGRLAKVRQAAFGIYEEPKIDGGP